MLVAPYPNEANSGVYRTSNAVVPCRIRMQLLIVRAPRNRRKGETNSQSLAEWNRFGITPEVNMISGLIIPPI